MNSRCLVIGGAGFIGSAVVSRLISLGYKDIHVVDDLSMNGSVPPTSEVHFHKIDFSNLMSAYKILDISQPRFIFHLAANSDIKKTSMDPLMDLRNTFQTTASLALAIASRKSQIESLVFSSSSAIYGFHENEIDETTVTLPESSYGWMKLSSEKLLEVLRESGLISKLQVLRFPNVTGLGQTHGVVKDLVAKYLDLNVPWRILGDGNQTKPYIHVLDLARIIVELGIGKDSSNKSQLNIAPPDSISVRQIVELIEVRGRLKRVPQFENSPVGWKGDVPTYSFKHSEEFQLLGFRLPSSKTAIELSINEEFRKHGK